MDLNVTIKTGDALADGDLIVNVGRVIGEPDVDGMFHTYMVRAESWNLRTGRKDAGSSTVVYHAADDVFVIAK